MDALIAEISSAYDRFGYSLGWRFLYGPKRTLSCPSGIVFLGLNPGGRRYSVDVSVEEGSAYIVERWGRRPNRPDGYAPGESPLQKQLRGLFDLLAANMPGDWKNGDELLAQTLAANFCPFRSPDWKSLSNRKEAVEFSRTLWTRIFDEFTPQLILTMSGLSYNQLKRVLGRDPEESSLPTGWGKVEFKIARYSDVTLARLPHLSTFKLMSRAGCVPHVAEFVRLVTN